MFSQIQVGPWETLTTKHTIAVSQQEISQLEGLAAKWVGYFPASPLGLNFMERQHGVPSPLIRFDYVLKGDGSLGVFEIEERPAGIGVLSHLNPVAYGEIAHRFRALDAGILVSKFRQASGSDDFYQPHIPVWLEGETQKTNNVYVRAQRSEKGFFQLLPQSVSTIDMEGDKSYGVKLGLWKDLPPIGGDYRRWAEELEELKSQSFALKFAQGSRFEGVKIWTTQKTLGRETWAKIRECIDSGQAKYIQPYISHETGHGLLPEGYSLFRRCYLVYNIVSKKYCVIGGLHMSVKGVRGHGTKESITGPLVV